MTGYTVNTGSNEKFSEGWDRIFSGSTQSKKSKTSAGATKATGGKQTRSGKGSAPKKSA